jgi:hypothetical protein
MIYSNNYERRIGKSIVCMERSCTVLVHESSFTTVSLHKTEKGAEIAVEFQRKTERKEHEEMYSNLSNFKSE